MQDWRENKRLAAALTVLAALVWVWNGLSLSRSLLSTSPTMHVSVPMNTSMDHLLARFENPPRQAAWPMFNPFLRLTTDGDEPGPDTLDTIPTENTFFIADSASGSRIAGIFAELVLLEDETGSIHLVRKGERFGSLRLQSAGNNKAVFIRDSRTLHLAVGEIVPFPGDRVTQ